MSSQSKQYILIAGLPRSGSTLLQAILNQSESTFTMPETHFFEQSGKISVSLSVTLNQALELLETLNNKWNISTQSLSQQLQISDAKTEIDLSELYFQLIECNRPAGGAMAIGVEKTPGNLCALDQLLNQHVHFKVILTSRNPLEFASSLSKQYWSPDSIIKISQLWNLSMIKITELEKKYPTRVMVLDYGEMTTKPEKAFESVFRFTDVEWKTSYLSNINAKADEFIMPLEAAWKAENVTLSNVRKSEKKSSLSWKQRLLLHRECFMTALGIGYIKQYKF